MLKPEEKLGEDMLKQGEKKYRAGAIVALSGGLDSTSALAWAHYIWEAENVFSVAFSYGQKHSVELESAKRVAKFYGRNLIIIEMPKTIFKGAGSALIEEDIPIELGDDYEGFHSRYGAQPTVVPGRNLNFIAMCASIAEVCGVDRVVLGVHSGDSGRWHYPDCSAAFIAAAHLAVHIGSDFQVSVEAPFVNSSKASIIQEAAIRQAPLHLTHSCYLGKRPACGKCSTCLERIDAFNIAGYKDPIEYTPGIPDWPDTAEDLPIMRAKAELKERSS